MKIVKKDEAEKFENSNECMVLEYPLKDGDIDCAITTITGRYPDKGYSINQKCKAMIYIIEGNGTLNTKEKSVSFEAGDSILINKEETYFWDASRCRKIDK